jgi:hypothetical protein
LSAPGLSVKGSDVVPDGESWQDSISLSGEQDAPGIIFDFDSADRNMTKQDVTQDSSTGAGE